ncbi:hypothetical protein EXN66_Car020055 [Channa argus]|uniref:Secreted protein n=1 Tax=Channa argus TaxID=215402 RepID=A0A6G1QQK6_CHAAH|nr:hypothetical protein EXN66_Car020055 [Channa argus]
MHCNAIFQALCLEMSLLELELLAAIVFGAKYFGEKNKSCVATSRKLLGSTHCCSNSTHLQGVLQQCTVLLDLHSNGGSCKA